MRKLLLLLTSSMACQEYTQQFTPTGGAHNVARAVMAIKGAAVAPPSGQGFIIVNPYKGTDGAGPYPNWYGTASHTHSGASGSTGTVPQMFTDGAALGLIMIPVNDKCAISPDPGSHPGQYYWPGYEETMTPQHMLCLGCATWPGARTSNQDAIDKMHAQGAIAVLSHPILWNEWLPSDIPTVAAYDGVEAVNGQGNDGWDFWDASLFAGRQVIGIAANDLYARGYNEVMYVNSPTNSMADLVANLRIGNFYGADVCTSTAQGCTVGHFYALRVTQSGNTVTAAFQYSETDSTPANPALVTWHCGYPTAGSVCGTGPSYTITGNELYVRAVLGNQNWAGSRAWSQPIYVLPTVNGVPPPVITSAHTAKVTVGSNFSYTITATNNPTSFGASGLPAGLTVNTANGVISGVPQSTGSFTMTLSAANAAGTGTNPLILTIVSVADGRVNVASNTNGATAVASSEYFNGQFPATNAITGNRSGANLSTGTGAWMDNTYGVYPDWLEVDFPGVKNIAEVDVYSLQDILNLPATPTAGMTFSLYGITDFEVQYYTGSAWVDVPGGHITGNNLVWRQIAFAPISTGKIRVLVNNSLAGYSRIADVEAYEPTTLPSAPVITSPTSATGIVGSSFTYTITATNNPTSFNATGLPAGLSVSTMTGVISGIPQSVGTSNVTLSATNTGGTGTILLIIGVSAPSPTSSAKFITLDALTQGSWKGVYGAEGFAINSDGINYPNYAQVSLSASAQSYVWPASYVDVRSLQQSAGSGRIASTWFSAGAFAIDMNLTDGTAHQVAVYAEDVDGYDGPRSETIEVRDAATSALLDSRSISNFGGGQYLVWTMQGHVVINVINTRPNSNALVNGFFFGGAGGALSRH